MYHVHKEMLKVSLMSGPLVAKYVVLKYFSYNKQQTTTFTVSVCTVSTSVYIVCTINNGSFDWDRYFHIQLTHFAHCIVCSLLGSRSSQGLPHRQK